jgi:hypothetical protein
VTLSVDGPVSIDAIASALSGPWQPAELAVVNDTVLRVARLDGEFPWHVHEEDEPSDRLQLCWVERHETRQYGN